MLTNLLSNVLKDEEDPRDFKYTPSKETRIFPEKFINSNIREIENQYNLSSCVANAACSSLEMMSAEKINLSRLFLYFNLRKDYLELNGRDKGSYTRDAFKYANRYGICSEEDYPYIIKNVNNEPSDEIYSKSHFKVMRYERLLRTINSIKDAVYGKNAVIFSMELGNAFYKVSGPLKDQKYVKVSNENPSIGSHAMSIVGWDDSLNGFIVENSWGDNWGDNGLFLLNYDLLTEDVWDVWTAVEIGVSKPTKPSILDTVKTIIKNYYVLFIDSLSKCIAYIYKKLK